MKHFIGTNTITGNEAAIKTYWLELEAQADSLVQSLERSNPNFILLNQSYTVDETQQTNQYYHTQHLVDSGIIQFGWDDETEQPVVVFIPSMLKLHRGLIAHNANTFLYLGKGWTEAGYSIWDFASLSSNQQAALQALWDEYGIVLDNPNILVGIFQDNDLTKKIAPGYVVICNVLEENENITWDSSVRQQWSSYVISPLGVSAGVFLPDIYTADDTSWKWYFIQNGLEHYGRNVWFVFNAPTARFTYIPTATGSTNTDFNWLNISTMGTYTFYAWDPLASTTTPTWSFRGVTDTGYDGTPRLNQPLIHRTYINDSAAEEEIFVDDTIEQGKSIFDERTNYFYTLNIKNTDTLPSAIGCNVRFG